mgnify:CR=1 FL=1
MIKNNAKLFLATTFFQVFGGRGKYKNLKESTALVFPKEIPDQVCKKLLTVIDDALEASAANVWWDKVGADARILGFETCIPDELFHFNLRSEIEDIERYLGRKVKSWFLMANRIRSISGNLGSGGGLHRDSPFSHQVKCIWYLTDVRSENGPFQYVPGSHLDAGGKNSRYPAGKYRFEKVNQKLIEVLAPAGSKLVCDTKCIHSGKPIELGARYAVTLYTFEKSDGARRFIEKSKRQ